MTNKADLETALENKCVKYAARFDYVGLKADKIKKGWPDQIFFGPYAMVIVVEFKLPGEKVKPKQKSIHAMLERLGFPVRVVYSLSEFVALLSSYGYYDASVAEALFPKAAQNDLEH